MTAPTQPNNPTSAQSWGIRLENVGVMLRGLDVLDGVTADIEPGSITAVIGPNGAGKTTLLLALLGQIDYRGSIHFLPPSHGVVEDEAGLGHGVAASEAGQSHGVALAKSGAPKPPDPPEARRVGIAQPGPSGPGEPPPHAQSRPAGPASARPTLGYVPQRLDFDRGIPLSVRDFLAGSVQRRPLWFGRRNGMRQRVAAVLERVGMQQFEKRRLGELSGGELQRVLLAQALLQEPQILLLDEPSSAVDVAGESLFCDLLQSVHQRRHLTTIWVSHDLSVVSSHADRVLCLNKSIACAGTPEAILTTERLQQLFGPHSTVYGHHDHAHHEHEPH